MSLFSLRDKHGLEKARDLYSLQESVRKFTDQKLVGIFDCPSIYQLDKNVFVERAMLASVSTYAYIDVDGVWYDRNDYSENDHEKYMEWLIQLNKEIDSVRDDTLISIFDYHC